MPQFAYKAMTQQGQPATGTVTAADRSGAVALLAQRGNYVVEIREATGAAGFRGGVSLGGTRVTARHRAALFRQLAVALQAGLNVVTALQTVRDQTRHVGLNQLVGDLIEKVKGGDALSEAMKQHRGSFTLMQFAMVRAGETAGVLEKVMVSLADFAERDLEVREKLRSASVYPIVVLILGFLSVLVILMFILPRIMETLTQTASASALPLPTRMLLGVSDFINSPAGVAALLAGVGVIAFLVRWMRTPEGGLTVDRWKLRLPIVGEAFRRVAMARFARTLGTLTGAGIQVVEAMRITRDTLGNEHLGRIVDAATADIVHGRAITEPLAESGEFPELLVQVIGLGERTGQLDTLLLTTADAYDREVNATLARVMSIVPVLFILALALVVAFILAAALLPIMTIDFGG